MLLKFVLASLLLWGNLIGLRAWGQKVLPPEKGALIGAYTEAGAGGDQVDVQAIREFEDRIGKEIAWTYFANNWLDGVIAFPAASVQACAQAGTTPYIRMMPWTEMRASGPDPYYTMDRFLRGEFDEPLIAWAKEAKAYGLPLMVEFGPEVNGNWFAWNGRWNGGSQSSHYGDPKHPDGPERFRDTYRRIIEIFRAEGVTNVTWVFHVDTSPVPDNQWNHSKYYYPGDDYIDWIGLSVFGAQLPTHNWRGFRPKLDKFWKQVEETSETKPVLIAEFAVIEDKKIPGRKAQWLEVALRTLRLDPKFARVKGISYWNSPGWLPNAEADFRITSSESALNSFIDEISNSHWQGRNVEN